MNDYTLFSMSFTYDPFTGIITHRGKRRDRLNRTLGYRQLSFRNRRYYAHRVAWLLYYKEWPVEYIDHINGDKQDNRIENLRDVNMSTNILNMSRFREEQGNRNIYLRNHRWSVEISGRSYGRFDSLEEARKVRDRRMSRIIIQPERKATSYAT